MSDFKGKMYKMVGILSVKITLRIYSQGLESVMQASIG